jgi:hypothetical protein
MGPKQMRISKASGSFAAELEIKCISIQRDLITAFLPNLALSSFEAFCWSPSMSRLFPVISGYENPIIRASGIVLILVSCRLFCVADVAKMITTQ